jgi:hypothetical protein
MISILVALGSGLIMVWSLFQLIRHKLVETRMGMAVYERLRGQKQFGGLLRAIVREPLLGLTKEAAHLPETRSMMRSYWMTGLYGGVFLVSLLVFGAATGLLSE